MPQITLNISANEKEIIETYAGMRKLSLDRAVKEAFFHRMEDILEHEEDMRAIEQYERDEADGKVEYYTHEEVFGPDSDS
jgi:Asp-tRNA(Asn)/Glu-tRNA(Gln) amidotransferase C subunit